MMTENELMDLVSKKGKQGGGYCTFLNDYKVPFIFSNFNGTSGDIDVLTHEAGHAFQVYESRDFAVPEYNWPTYESAEIHSMSMEFFTWPWMNLFFKEDTDKYKFDHLSSGLLFIPYGVAVDEFQHFVYANPKLHQRNANRHGATLRRPICHILITKIMRIWSKVVSGISRATSSHRRSTTLTIR